MKISRSGRHELFDNLDFFETSFICHILFFIGFYMTDLADNFRSPQAVRALRSLGENLRVARLNRRISMRGLAERMGVSTRTVARLEKGECGVGIGTLAMACLVLGEIDRVANFLEASDDDLGLQLARQHLPKRIREHRTTASGPTDDRRSPPTPEDDTLGTAF